MLAIGLRLLGIGKWLREAATALLGIIGRYPWQSACIALLALSGVLWHGKTKAIGQRDAEIAARAADRKAYTAAQAEARQDRRADLRPLRRF